MRIELKRFLGIMFSLAMVLGLMSGMSLTAHAEEKEYDLWIGNTKVTSKNMTDVFNDGKVSFTPTGEHAGTLKLKDYTGKGECATNHRAYIDYTDYDGTLTIIASGSNTIHNTSNQTGKYGIQANGNLIIKGDGVLTVDAGDCTGDHCTSIAIVGYPKRYLNIQEKVTVYAIGGNAGDSGDSRGIACETLNIGATLNASGIDTGIQASSININNTGILEAVGNDEAIIGKVYNALPGYGWQYTVGT